MFNKLLLSAWLLFSSAIAADDKQETNKKVQIDTQSGYETEAVLAAPDDVVIVYRDIPNK